MEDPGREMSPEQLIRRDALIKVIGSSALLDVNLPSPEEIQQTLNDEVGAKPASRRRTHLYPIISTLGGETLSAVDLVLTIQDMVDKFKEENSIPIPVIEDQMVPQYLSVITKGEDKSVRESLSNIWREIRNERQPKMLVSIRGAWQKENLIQIKV